MPRAKAIRFNSLEKWGIFFIFYCAFGVFNASLDLKNPRVPHSFQFN